MALFTHAAKLDLEVHCARCARTKAIHQFISAASAIWTDARTDGHRMTADAALMQYACNMY